MQLAQASSEQDLTVPSPHKSYEAIAHAYNTRSKLLCNIEIPRFQQNLPGLRTKKLTVDAMANRL
jgi:hypothetical protein